MASPEPHAVQFFERQFQRQVADRDFVLNPFEKLTLPHIHGSVLELGCGLGNLALEAARRRCQVHAVDGSPTAIDRLRAAAIEENLPVEAIQTDLASYAIQGSFDTVIAIGLLMFFPMELAHRLLDRMKIAVRPGGTAVVNVLVEGTTYREMLDPGSHYLFGASELEEAFFDWEIIESEPYSSEAAENRVKLFRTIIARKPGVGPT